MDRIISLIKSIENEKSNLNPTLIYNEGWMIRLLLQESIKEGVNIEGLEFNKISNWTSEALISSPFVSNTTKREGYTHPDIIFGDFDVKYEKSGKIIPKENPKLLGIIEAKMGSNLSKKTLNADNYNQASRNLVCLASNTINNMDCSTYFIVVAPEKSIKKFNTEKQIEVERLIKEIERRFVDNPENLDSIIEIIKKTTIKAISYEVWIEKFDNTDIKDYLSNFYGNSLKWNRIKK